jgi:hypothetical protein
MMTFDQFSDTMHSKTTRKRELKGLKKITKPNMKKAYNRLTEDPEVASMSEDQQLSYFVGWFSL